MKNFIKKYRVVLGITVLFILTVTGLGVFQYNNDLAATSKVSMLQKQVAALGLALQNSNTESEATKQQIKTITDQNQNNVVIANPQEDITTTVAKASQAVVSIMVLKNVALMDVQYVNPFSNDPNLRNAGIQVPVLKKVGNQNQQVAAATGFIIRPDGYILTNKHVVADPQASYTVLLSSGEKKSAKVVYRDSTNDIAIIKIDGQDFPTVSLGNSSELKLGQTVAAIGNALGQYDNSVSVGIISGLNRTIEAQDDQGNIEKLSGILQTDTAINPGNSGGPLLDLSGHVVGINVAIDEGANNIAFAIPVNEIKSAINQALP